MLFGQDLVGFRPHGAMYESLKHKMPSCPGPCAACLSQCHLCTCSVGEETESGREECVGTALVARFGGWAGGQSLGTEPRSCGA